jgi:hypothetical protein
VAVGIAPFSSKTAKAIRTSTHSRTTRFIGSPVDPKTRRKAKAKAEDKAQTPIRAV